MATRKTEITEKKTATDKVSATEKKAVQPVVKPAARKAAEKTPESATEKIEKKPKMKVVRNFSMPQIEYQKIAEIKEACLKAGLRIKRSEVLRAGLKTLGGMNGVQLKRAMAGMGKIKLGHPNKP